MKLTFYGATREVTGSCYLLEANGKNILVDCGMVQGPDIYEEQHLSFVASKIHAVILTHAHIDHSGLLPLLVKNNFKGKIYATRPTRDLACIMLKDSAHIQESEAEWRNKRAKRAGIKSYQPIYTGKDVLNANKLFKGCDYDTEYEIYKGVFIKFIDAGHLLGSASVQIKANESGEERTIVFSGDIGNVNKPILRSPQTFSEADYVVMESTYGDRLHEKESDHVRELASIIQETLDKGGNVVIPSFAVGRMQEMLYYLREIKEKKLIVGHEHFPVYVDSPLAVEATKLFNKRYDCFDEEMTAMLEKGINPISFDDLHLAVSVEDSKAINHDFSPKVILSASGMCEAGRIKHHLKYNLWRKDSSIVFVGYQVVGTLGRTIVDGAKTVNLLGETICISANIRTLNSTSSHADMNGLLDWIASYKDKPKHVFVTHGDETASVSFANLLSQKGYISTAPEMSECWDLLTNECIRKGTPRKAKDKSKLTDDGFPKSSMYLRLEEAGRMLSAVIRENQGGTNFDLRNFAEEIEKLCEKYKR